MTKSFSEKHKKSDLKLYETLYDQIHTALAGRTGIICSGVSDFNKPDIFYMLCFCLCVPQSKAIKAEVAVQSLRAKKFHKQPLTKEELLSTIRGHVRFQNTKGFRLLQARSEFFLSDLWSILKQNYTNYMNHADKPELRMDLLTHLRRILIGRFNGMGFKVASHFMRNIGMPGLAILDVHILNGMKERKLIPVDFKLTPKKYEETEKLFLNYAEFVGISGDELDLMLWSAKTGYVFK